MGVEQMRIKDPTLSSHMMAFDMSALGFSHQQGNRSRRNQQSLHKSEVKVSVTPPP